MQSLKVSSYRTRKRINIQNGSALLYTDWFYVYKKNISDLKEKRSYFPFWWRTNYVHRHRDKKWNERTEQKVCHKAWQGIQPTAKLKSDHKGPPAPGREDQTWSWKAASFSIRSDIKISWGTWGGGESLVKQLVLHNPNVGKWRLESQKKKRFSGPLSPNPDQRCESICCKWWEIIKQWGYHMPICFIILLAFRKWMGWNGSRQSRESPMSLLET